MEKTGQEHMKLKKAMLDDKIASIFSFLFLRNILIFQRNSERSAPYIHIVGV